MIAIKDTWEIPKYCNYWDAETRRWIECPIYKSCKHHTCNIDEKPSGCPLVEIVTCKDCDYRCTGGLCTKHDITVTKDFYCGDAERRE